MYYKTVVHSGSFFNAMAGSMSVSAVCGVSNSERAEYQKNMKQKKLRQVQRSDPKDSLIGCLAVHWQAKLHWGGNL